MTHAKDGSHATAISDLNDDTVKLVAYTLVSVKRDEERVLPKGTDQVVVTSALSEEAFVAYVVGQYFQSKGYKELTRVEKVKEEDRKYIRVHYVVSRRWPREPIRFEERQIDALSRIRDAIPGGGRSSSF